MNFTLNRSTFEGYGEILTGAVLWSLAGILAKMVKGMSVQSIIFYRVTFGFIIFFTFLLASGNMKVICLKDKKKFLITLSMLRMLSMLAYFASLLRVSVSVAVLLLYTAPVYVAIFSPLLLKENITKKGIIALIVSITGIFFIVEPNKLDFSYSVGIAAGILSGISYAFEILTSKYVGQSYTGYTQAFWSFAIAVLILLPVGIVPPGIVSGNIVYLILLAIFPTILAVSLYFNGLKKVKASSASILGLIEPVSAVILAVLILGERITIPVLLGGALILAGAAIVMRER